MPADAHHHAQRSGHQRQSKIVPRRRNTEIENEAALTKRRGELLRERKILLVMTVLCGIATAVHFILSLYTLPRSYGMLIHFNFALAAVGRCIVDRFLDRRGLSPEQRH